MLAISDRTRWFEVPNSPTNVRCYPIKEKIFCVASYFYQYWESTYRSVPTKETKIGGFFPHNNCEENACLVKFYQEIHYPNPTYS